MPPADKGVFSDRPHFVLCVQGFHTSSSVCSSKGSSSFSSKAISLICWAMLGFWCCLVSFCHLSNLKMQLSSYTDLQFEIYAAWKVAILAAVSFFGSLYRLCQSSLSSLNISESTAWLVLHDIQAHSRHVPPSSTTGPTTQSSDQAETSRQPQAAARQASQGSRTSCPTRPIRAPVFMSNPGGSAATEAYDIFHPPQYQPDPDAARPEGRRLSAWEDAWVKDPGMESHPARAHLDTGNQLCPCPLKLC